jgi:hypothetical protein
VKKILHRHIRVSFVALALVLAVMATGCGFSAGTGGSAGAVTGEKIGFSPGGGLVWASDADQSRDLDNAASTGAKWIRLDVNWTGVESIRGVFRWNYVDRAVNAIHARGMHVLMTLDYTPTWARKSSCQTSMFCPPADVNTYANFAGQAAARYGPVGVHAYEVWNEANLNQWWVGGPDAPGYVALLKAAYPAIHGGDPAATVVTAGLAPHGDLGRNPTDPISPVNFLKAMYAAGAQGYFDAFGLHPYPPMPHAPLSGKVGWNAMLQTALEHDIMVANGDGQKQIWGTEYGTPTGTDGMSVSEATQAQYMIEGFNYWAGLSFTGPLFVHTIRDGTTTGSDWSHHMGITRADFSPKPAHAALHSLVFG